MFNIGQLHDTWEPISFKLGVMLDMTKLYDVIAVWITLTVTQGHRVVGKARTSAAILMYSCMNWPKWLQ